MSWRTENVINLHTIDEWLHDGDRSLRPDEEPPLASHLVSPRIFYEHHGIYVGNGRVIHYGGLARGLRHGPVEEISLERFAGGHQVRVRPGTRLFDRCEVVARARSRLGERSYRILTNNCEHFCAWALRDERRSGQVERLGAMPRALYTSIDRHHRAIARTLRLWWDRATHTASCVS